jgi:hypothetical protein
MVALAWVTAVSLTPDRDQPYPLGSTDGSVWNVVFVFNGIGRLTQSPGVYGIRRSHTVQTQPDRGLRRLFGTSVYDYRNRIGGQLLAALALGLLATLSHLGALFRRPPSERERLARAGAAYLGVWLLTGFVLYSSMSVLLPRYLEAFTPAVAGSLGVAVVTFGRMMRRRWLWRIGAALVGAVALDVVLRHRPPGFIPTEPVKVTVVAAIAALAALAAVGPLAPVRRRLGGAPSVLAVALASVAILLPGLEVARSDTTAGMQDSGRPGRQPAAVTRRLSRFLRAHNAGARYEVATFGLGASSLIVRDDLPVLFLGNLGQRALVSLPAFERLVNEGQVRFVLIGPCPHHRRHCDTRGSTGSWIRQHGRDVSAQIGLPRSTILQVGGR